MFLNNNNNFYYCNYDTSHGYHDDISISSFFSGNFFSNSSTSDNVFFYLTKCLELKEQIIIILLSILLLTYPMILILITIISMILINLIFLFLFCTDIEDPVRFPPLVSTNDTPIFDNLFDWTVADQSKFLLSTMKKKKPQPIAEETFQAIETGGTKHSTRSQTAPKSYYLSNNPKFNANTNNNVNTGKKKKIIAAAKSTKKDVFKAVPDTTSKKRPPPHKITSPLIND